MRPAEVLFKANNTTKWRQNDRERQRKGTGKERNLATREKKEIERLVEEKCGQNYDIGYSDQEIRKNVVDFTKHLFTDYVITLSNTAVDRNKNKK